MYCNSQGGKSAFIGFLLFFIVQPSAGQAFQEELRQTLEKSTQESPALLRGNSSLSWRRYIPFMRSAILIPSGLKLAG